MRNEPPEVAIRLSVVIPTYRRPDLLKRCLSALAAQTLDPRLYEVVVVDDGASLGTWKTVRAVAAAAPIPAIRYFAAPSRKGPAAAPKNIIMRPAIPLTLLGKPDKRALRLELAAAQPY